MRRSLSMTSYERAPIFSRASRPFLAVSTSYPSSPKESARTAATSGSSSTTRMQVRRAPVVDGRSLGIRAWPPDHEVQARDHPLTREKLPAYRDLPSVSWPKMVTHDPEG